jgi:hypothetical protein
MPWEGAVPRSAHGPNSEAGAACRVVDRLEHISQYPCSNAKIFKILN